MPSQSPPDPLPDLDSDPLTLLRAIYSSDLGVHPRGSGSLLVVNLRDLSDDGEGGLLGTLSAAYSSDGVCELKEVRTERDGLDNGAAGRAMHAARLAFDAAGGDLDAFPDAVAAACDSLRLEPPAPPEPDAQPQPGGQEAARLLLLRLHHMRRPAPYCALIRRWASELGLRGGVYFRGRLILILLLGSAAGCGEYLRRHRTETVDVDSAGRKCREKMMDVLHDGPPLPGGDVEAGFIVSEEGDREGLVRVLRRAGVPEAVLSDLSPPRGKPHR
ncbi:hypothetical protein DFJ74DRAFT_700671 [Hyaloraphidium curvatum]|nr:hypothetical protein DFJ74DRAFT_700671 [Hyaloraphidium curvatum]